MNSLHHQDKPVKLIIESGATKTHWRIVHGDKSNTDFIGSGFNITQQKLSSLEVPELIIKWKDNTIEVHAFLAGYTDGHKPDWEKYIQSHFPKLASQEVYSDLMASCLATAKNTPGLIGILGTGSNACYFDGARIQEKAEPLGYILGDEGSGFHLGKQLINDYFNKRMPKDVEAAFYQDFKISKADVFAKVYKGTRVKSYVAQFAKFLNHRNDTYSIYVLHAVFSSYLIKYIVPLHEKNQLPLYFTGSIAENFKNHLQDCCSKHNMELRMVVGNPMEELTLYFQNFTS